MIETPAHDHENYAIEDRKDIIFPHQPMRHKLMTSQS
jgi:hypothetical protein